MTARSRPPRRRRARAGIAIAAIAIAVGLAACGSSESVVAPEVEGLSVEESVQRVCGRFLEPSLQTDQDASPSAEPTIVGSDPPGGTEVDVGSTVTLLVSPSPSGEALVFAAPSCDVP